MLDVKCTCDGRLRPAGFDDRVDFEAGLAWARLHDGDALCAVGAAGVEVFIEPDFSPGLMAFLADRTRSSAVVGAGENTWALAIAAALHLVGECGAAALVPGDDAPRGVSSRFLERAVVDFARGFMAAVQREPVAEVWARDLRDVDLDPVAPVTVPLTSPRHWLAGFPRAPKGSLRDRRNEIRDSLGEIAALEQIPGLSLSILQTVHRAAFTTLDAIASASDEDLERVRRVGPARARALRAGALQLLEAWPRDPCGSGDGR